MRRRAGSKSPRASTPTSGCSASTSRSARCCCCGRRCPRCGSRRSDRRRGSSSAFSCIGTLLMRSAGCAINDYADRDFDAHVERTANRPLARGEIAPWEALAVAAVLALCALLLVLRLNRDVLSAVGAGAGDRHRVPVLQALLRPAAGVSRHRVLVRHSDGFASAGDGVTRLGWGCSRSICSG